MQSSESVYLIGQCLLGISFINEMSSQRFLLNVFFRKFGSKYVELNMEEIEVLIDRGKKPLLKRLHLGQCIRRSCIITLTAKLAEEVMKPWTFLQAERYERL